MWLKNHAAMPSSGGSQSWTAMAEFPHFWTRFGMIEGVGELVVLCGPGPYMGYIYIICTPYH
jgi:hypothetical protein